MTYRNPRLAEALARMRGAFEINSEILAAAAAAFKSYVPDINLNRFREALAQLPNHLVQLSRFGWYLDMAWAPSTPGKLLRLMEEEGREALELRCEEYFREKTDAIGRSLATRHPTRSQILEDAFDAHREGKYTLSVPVLLIQADGLCFDAMSCGAFEKQNGRLTIGSRLSNGDLGTISEIASEPLRQAAPLWMSKKQRPDDFNELNRHQVQHGESTDYGTERNSLKAISFIWYISEMLRWEQGLSEG